MQIGGSLFLIAIGAVLRWAVTYRLWGVDIPTVGTILLVVGVIGLIVSLFLWTTRRRDPYIEPRV